MSGVFCASATTPAYRQAVPSLVGGSYSFGCVFVDFFLISDDEVFKLFDHVGDVKALEYLLRVFFEDFLLLCVVSEVMYGFAEGGYIAGRNEYAGFAIHENFFGAGGCGCGNDRAV